MPVSVVEIRGDTGPLEDALSKLPAEGRAAARGMAKRMLGEMEDLDKAMDPLTDAIKSARGVSNREAKRMAKGIIKANARAASAIEKEYDRSFTGQFSALKGLSSAVFGGVAGDAFDAAEAIGGASAGAAALGMALGGVAIGGVAIAGLAAGLVSLTNAGAEALVELRELGPAVAALVSDSARQNLDDYVVATDRLAIAAKIAAAEIGGELAPALTTAADESLRIVTISRMLSGAWESTGYTVDSLTDKVIESTMAMGGGASGVGLAMAATKLGIESLLAATSVDELKREIDGATNAATAANFQWNMLSDGFGPLITNEERAQVRADELAAAHDRAAAAARRRKKDQDDLAAATSAVAEIKIGAEFDAAFEAQGEINRKAGEWLLLLDRIDAECAAIAVQFDELPDKINVASLAAEGLAYHLENAFTSIDAIGQQAIGTMGNIAELQEIKIQESVDNRRKSQKRNAKENARERKAAIDQLLREGKITTEQHERRLEESEKRKKRRERDIDKLTKKEQKAARRSFRLMKTGQIAAAVMQSATAALSLIPSVAYAGYGAPAVALGIVAPFLATQIALIASQDPPEYPGGRVPGMSGDHELIGIQRSEVVLNSRASAALGAEDAQRLNDTGRTGDDAPIVAVFEIDGRELLQLTGRRRRTGHLTTQRF